MGLEHVWELGVEAVDTTWSRPFGPPSFLKPLSRVGPLCYCWAYKVDPQRPQEAAIAWGEPTSPHLAFLSDILEGQTSRHILSSPFGR